MTVRTRAAPSPTGNPHVGTASIALYDFVFARANQGHFVLRIEDTDRTRSTKESEQQILDSFRWLGLQCDEGPEIGGPYGPYRQSERTEIYRHHTKTLLNGGHVYRCFCSPEDLARERQERDRAKLPGKLVDRCRSLTTDEVDARVRRGDPFTVRLKVPETGEVVFRDYLRGEVTFRNEQIDDQVLMKSDGFPTYHLANVIDDHLMNISHVLRGEEWISSTPKHILLYRAFGWEPPVFVHLSLLRSPEHKKLSKRDGVPTGILQYRDGGYLPEALLNFLALMSFSMSDGREVFSLDEMIGDFSLDRLKTTAPVFDTQKLEWLNGEYIRRIPAADLISRLRDVVPLARTLDAAALEPVLPLARERMKTLLDFESVVGFLFAAELHYEAALLVPKKCDAATAKLMLELARSDVQAAPRWAAGALEEKVRLSCDAHGWKLGSFLMPLRVAITGSTASPPLFESMELLGREACLARIDRAIALLGPGPETA